MATRDYVIKMPKDTTVRAACEDIGCEAWRYGWEIHVDEATALGTGQAAFIREKSRRTFREQRTGAGITIFIFEAGQRCFAEHRTRPARLLVATGGHTVREHTDMAGWAEDMTEHVARVEATKQRG